MSAARKGSPMPERLVPLSGLSNVYELTGAEFDALASGLGGPDAIRVLWRARETKHLVMIRAIHHLAATATPDSVAALESGHALLAAALEYDAERAGTVLRHPGVGAWLALCLRRLTGTADGTTPRGAELEQLCAVAAAAAMRAGLPFESTVPRRRGKVFLPGFGLARFDGADATGPATIRYDGARTWIEADGCVVSLPDDPAEDGDGWLGLRRLRSDVDGVVIEIELDDLDPERIGHGETIAPRLSAAEVAEWQRLLTASWQVLVRDHPDRAAELSAGFVAIVPLVPDQTGNAMSITARDAFGAMCAAPIGTGRTFADNLIHEFQHSKLYALADIVPLHTADAAPVHYSPWREDPRPLEGLLHGAYSFIGVAGYWDMERRLLDDGVERDNAEFEFWRSSRQVLAVIDVLLDSGHLTEAGTRFVLGMAAAAGCWQAGSDPRQRRLADLAVADHRIRWRLRNRSPESETVRRLADGWRSGTACPQDPAGVPAKVLPSSSKQPMSDRVRLIQRWLRQPAALDEVSAGGRVGPADAALLRGDRDRAYEGYLSLVADGPDDIEAWAGLALSRHATDFRGVDAPVWATPEVLFALHRELRTATDGGPDVAELAAWLAPRASTYEPA